MSKIVGDLRVNGKSLENQELFIERTIKEKLSEEESAFVKKIGERKWKKKKRIK